MSQRGHKARTPTVGDESKSRKKPSKPKGAEKVRSNDNCRDCNRVILGTDTMALSWVGMYHMPRNK